MRGRPRGPAVSASVVQGLRLMFGTLTVLPVPAPTSVDRRTAGAAMLLAPLAGLVLAVPLVLLASLADAPLLVAATRGRRAGPDDPGPAPGRSGRHRGRAWAPVATAPRRSP